MTEGAGPAEAVLAALLKTRAEARRAGLDSVEQLLRETIRRSLPMHRPLDEQGCGPVCWRADEPPLDECALASAPAGGGLPEPDEPRLDEFESAPEPAGGGGPEACEPSFDQLFEDGAAGSGSSEDDLVPHIRSSLRPMPEGAAARVAQLARLPVLEDRRSDRRVVNLAADLRAPGAALAEAEVANISSEGVMIRTRLDVEIGSCVWLKLPGFEALKCQVVWAEDGGIGCRFLTPLYDLTLEMILAPPPPKRRKRLFSPPAPALASAPAANRAV